MKVRMICISTNFYPRSPCGERRVACYLDNIEITISIHALLAESDFRGRICQRNKFQFLSTLSLRRATPDTRRRDVAHRISIHALLAESDVSTMIITTCTVLFLSTLSLRRATARLDSRQQPAGISIHALLAESDFVVGR